MGLRDWRKKRENRRLSKKAVKRSFTRDQIADIKAHSGDSGANIEEIKLIQEQARNKLRAEGIDIEKMVPEVGREIEWYQIVAMVFRVLDFDRNNTSYDPDGGPDNVRAVSQTDPYGYLLVESPTLNQKIKLPIIHNTDFFLATTVFDEPKFLKEINGPRAELLVTYAPKRTRKDGRSGSPHHVLHYAMVPRGTLEKYYSDDEVGTARMGTPEPNLIFGDFVYDGEVRVNVLDPSI